MKHWQPPSLERAAAGPRPRRDASLASIGGLLIAAALVIGLAWALAPVSPVAPELLR